MTKYVRETAAAKSISAWVILKGSRYVATVQAHFGNSRVLVNIWQHGEEMQSGTASGYGYDKLTAALAGLKIDGHELTDHCSRLGAPKPPKGNAGLFPRDYKPRAGFSLSNWTRASRETGKRFHAYDWNDKARRELGLPDDGRLISDSQFQTMADLADNLKKAWEESPDYAEGYADCYRESGLKYLEKLGYSVHSAI